MATTAERTEPAPSPAPAASTAPLDDVMLAMDVVDTLRHERDLVAKELDEESRARELTARVRAIYASQGIEVPDELIAQGVESLRKDRFTYVPPERTFAVRLAELYVERGKWAKRALLVVIALAVVWGAFTIPQIAWRRSQREAFVHAVADTGRQLHELANDAASLARDLDSARAAAGGPQADALLEGASQGLTAARARIAELQALRTSAFPEAMDYDADRERLDLALADQRRALVEVGTALGAVRGQLQGVTLLRDVAGAVARTIARLDGVEVEPTARVELTALARAAETALASGDADAARATLAELTALVDQLDQTYELRIVSRPGAQSGVWRVPNDRPNARNYYVIVEAVAPDGRRLALPITSEETKSTKRATAFGVRVPEQVFEGVKSDKLDNGIVDRDLFGVKKRGARAPEYRFTVTGGMITEW